jgi:hypothetical protein
MPRFRRSRCRGFGVHDAVNFAGGAALLWVLGQIAVLGPALRAAMIPLRSV